VIEKEKEATLLLVHNERMQDKENIWYLDNEANNHMYRDKDKFMELDKVVDCAIYLSTRYPIKSLNSMTPQESFWKHWLCTYRWSSKDQARW
jgi:hypothetical protein